MGMPEGSHANYPGNDISEQLQALGDQRCELSHRETWPLRGKHFQAWLRQHYYERTWDAPTPAALNVALNVLEAQAQFDGPQRKVSLRLSEQDGLIYLDLADEFWRCIEISANGWRIAQDPPVRFRRSAGMQPLPLPLRGGSIEALAPFLNLASENDFVLVVAWLLGALRAGGPYPSGLGYRRRTRISQDRPLEASAGGDRPQRGAGAGPAAR
jgi:hypothetical protein